MEHRKRIRSNTFYVVFRGRNPGVYATWENCAENVMGYGGSLFRSFSSREEAVEALESFMRRSASEVPLTSRSPCRINSFYIGLLFGFIFGAIIGKFFYMI